MAPGAITHRSLNSVTVSAASICGPCASTIVNTEATFTRIVASGPTKPVEGLERDAEHHAIHQEQARRLVEDGPARRRTTSSARRAHCAISPRNRTRKFSTAAGPAPKSQNYRWTTPATGARFSSVSSGMPAPAHPGGEVIARYCRPIGAQEP
ncbi:MAG: hypothetical protein IPH86_16185 [bacterium]|nr:hypothetical protein [bacterium]